MPGDMLDIVVMPIKIVPVEHVAVLHVSISYGIYSLKAEAWVACSPGRVGDDSRPIAYNVFLSYDDNLDWLTLIEFGRVENAQPPDRWRGVSESFGYILRHPGGPEIGFKVLPN